MGKSSILCPKCRGFMRFNLDNDLSCMICGKVIVLVIRRNYDSITGKIRDKKKKRSGSDLDSISEVDSKRIRNRSPQNNSSTMARQGGLFRI